jgi:hypothetical protein
VIQTGPGLGNGGGITQHAHGTLDLRQVSSWDNSGRLVVDANLESCGAPVHKLDGTLGFDGGNGCIDIFRYNISSEQQATSHILAMSGITFDHLVGRFKTGIADFGNG